MLPQLCALQYCPSLPKIPLPNKTSHTDISLEFTASARGPNLPSRILLPRGHPRRKHHQGFRQLRQGNVHRALGFHGHKSGLCHASEGTGPGRRQALQQERRQLPEGYQPRSERGGCLICRLNEPPPGGMFVLGWEHADGTLMGQES